MICLALINIFNTYIHIYYIISFSGSRSSLTDDKKKTSLCDHLFVKNERSFSIPTFLSSCHNELDLNVVICFNFIYLFFNSGFDLVAPCHVATIQRRRPSHRPHFAQQAAQGWQRSSGLRSSSGAKSESGVKMYTLCGLLNWNFRI